MKPKIKITIDDKLQSCPICKKEDFMNFTTRLFEDGIRITANCKDLFCDGILTVNKAFNLKVKVDNSTDS